MSPKKQGLVVCRGTYRGVQVLECEGKFVLYLGADRHEFEKLPDATKFIDDWIALKKN